jgi:cysteinyl-tRNA synthetase
MQLPQLYNTLTRSLEPVVTRNGKVGIYCCGPTVYDVPHAGNARAALVPDVLVRFLRSMRLEVTYVRNITDVDDKILNRAKQAGTDPLELSAKMAEVYQDLMGQLGCLAPTHEPKVSENIADIIGLVEKIIERGSGYVVERTNGTRDVYFSVRNFPEYGKLSRRKIDELRVGARIERDEEKGDPLDFALWKGASADEWGWDSPWGRGRPGWHIECSAMSQRYLGHGFSVHTGGMDLIFPHHENEIAQSEAAHPDAGPFAQCWMHNGFLNVDKEKMSKSLGNFVTVPDVLNRNDPEGFRWFLLTAHYRAPIQLDTEILGDGRVTFPSIDEAERRTDYFYATIERLAELQPTVLQGEVALPKDLMPIAESVRQSREQAKAALLDDLNTPLALAALGELLKSANELCDLKLKRRKDPVVALASESLGGSVAEAIRNVADWLGLGQSEPADYRERTRRKRADRRGLTLDTISKKVVEREAARKARDFGLSDALRDELLTWGVNVKDTAAGPVWSISLARSATLEPAS